MDARARDELAAIAATLGDILEEMVWWRKQIQLAAEERVAEHARYEESMNRLREACGVEPEAH